MGNPVHHLTAAATLLVGGASFEPHKKLYDGRRGQLMNAVYLKSWGAPAAIVANALVSAATGAELPNNATITYTTATDAASPLDGTSKPTVAAITDINGVSRSVWPLDVARNVSMIVTHGSSIVALSCLVSGYDEYGQPMTETLAVTATGTSKTATGKKAFKSILSYAFTSAGNATADTAGLQWGDKLGLPYRCAAVENVVPFGNAIIDVSGTVTKADDTTATATTGDPRGTYAPASATDGTKKYAAWLIPSDSSVAQPAGLFGNVQA